MRRPHATLLLLATSGCLGPQVSDEIAERDLILPPGSEVPSIYDDPALAKQIDDNDGVGAVVPLLSGFAAGQPVRFWDVGPAPAFAAPVFSLRRRNAEGQLEKIGHPPIFEHIPGDPGYSPFWALFVVEVTASYAGEVLPSIAALQQAQEEGLVLSPRLQPINIDCPILAKGVTVDTGGPEPVAPQGKFYWNGRSGSYYDFGETALPDRVHVPVIDFYVLRREGGEPLSEPARGVDMNGDGDLRDSNDIFARPRGDPAFSPACREVLVTVPQATASIDGPGDAVDVKAADQLFVDGRPTARVIAFTEGERRFNCPILVEDAAPGARP